MKTFFKGIATLRTLAPYTATLWLLSLLGLFPLAPAAFSKVPVIITLRSGVTDLQIQQTLDALPNDGGEVLLPKGKILIHQPLYLRRDNQSLRGAGVATVLRLADHANCPVLILGEPVNHPSRTVRHLRVADLFIDGNRRNQQRELWRLAGEGSEIRNNGITVQGVSDSVVENVTCAACRSGGLVSTLGVTRLTVCGLTAFDNQFDGLACYFTTHSAFSDLHLHDNPGAGISLDLAFDHNVINHALLAGNDLGIFMRASKNNQFRNVTIDDSHHFGVFIAHSEQYIAGVVQPAPHSECTQNVFTNLIARNCGSAAFRVNNSTCVNNVLIHPQFEGNFRGGLSQPQPELVSLQ
jgi:hypothetical protein